MLYAIMHQNDSNQSLYARLKYLTNEIEILREEKHAIEGLLDQRSSDEFRKTMDEYYHSKGMVFGEKL